MNRLISIATLAILIAVTGCNCNYSCGDEKGNMSSVATHTVGASGYDLVSYFNPGSPVLGDGNNLSMHKGTTYLFSSKMNKEKFDSNPDKYLPAYGGYCAYGVAVKKKFAGNPNVWKVVDGKLYLNLDKKISGIWKKDINGNIRKANSNWTMIQSKSPSDL